MIEKAIHCAILISITTISTRNISSVCVDEFIRDAVHNFIDGLIIGASYLVSIPVGIATIIAVAMHEIPQEIEILVFSAWWIFKEKSVDV